MTQTAAEIFVLRWLKIRKNRLSFIRYVVYSQYIQYKVESAEEVSQKKERKRCYLFNLRKKEKEKEFFLRFGGAC